MEDFNDNHPELREGEAMATNHHIETINSDPFLDGFDFRIGNQAYDRHGSKLNWLVPIFMSKSEATCWTNNYMATTPRKGE